MPYFLCQLIEMDQKRGDEETVHLYVDSQSNNCGHPPVLTVVSNHIYPMLKIHRLIILQVSKNQFTMLNQNLTTAFLLV